MTDLAARLPIEAELSELIGAERGERTPKPGDPQKRLLPRRWDTRADELELKIPKLRRQLPPELPAPAQVFGAGARGEMVQQVCVCGVSTRRVDRSSSRFGLRVSRSEVSRICCSTVCSRR